MLGFPWRGLVRSCPGPTNGPRAPRRLKRSGPPRTGGMVPWGTKNIKKLGENPQGRFKSHWNPLKHHLCSWSILDFPIMNSLVPVLKNSNMARTRPSRIWWWKLGRGCHLLLQGPFFAYEVRYFRFHRFFLKCEVFQVFQVSQVSYVRDWCYIPIFNSPGLHFYHVQGRMWRCPESWLWRSPRSVLSLGIPGFSYFWRWHVLERIWLTGAFYVGNGWVAGGCWDDDITSDEMDHSRKFPAFSPSKMIRKCPNPPCYFPTSSFWRWWVHHLGAAILLHSFLDMG